MRFFATLAVVFTAVLAASPIASSGQPTLQERRASLEAAVVREMNVIRTARGLRPLHAAPRLRTAARDHSQAMLVHGFFGHDSADGTTFSERIKRYYTNRGFATWSVGEALLASEGQDVDAKAVVSAWLNSPPHREIVLSPTWRDAGIGVLYDPSAPPEFGGGEAIAVTADFGVRE
jgi:uncharacterized protein YkwD